MLRFLIVEDIEATRTQVVEFLSETFARSQIDGAATVKEGLRLIEKALEGQRPYHAAILDFRLPRDTGENPDMCESLCDAIRTNMATALIVHFTAFPDHEAIRSHVVQKDLDSHGPRAKLISKLEADWPNQLVAELKSYLYGTRINEQMDELFGKRASSGMERQRWVGGDPCAGQNTTHQLAALSRDIVAHWDDIDETLKRRIEGVFHVDAEKRPIRVSLL